MDSSHCFGREKQKRKCTVQWAHRIWLSGWVNERMDACWVNSVCVANLWFTYLAHRQTNCHRHGSPQTKMKRTNICTLIMYDFKGAKQMGATNVPLQQAWPHRRPNFNIVRATGVLNLWYRVLACVRRSDRKLGSCKVICYCGDQSIYWWGGRMRRTSLGHPMESVPVLAMDCPERLPQQAAEPTTSTNTRRKSEDRHLRILYVCTISSRCLASPNDNMIAPVSSCLRQNFERWNVSAYKEPEVVDFHSSKQPFSLQSTKGQPTLANNLAKNLLRLTPQSCEDKQDVVDVVCKP